ncbi:MAG: hypothetical protein KAS23_08905 [Anaerohalosphaera sp.]|nr:hypothetical protein [Anaerohalosphaera sp.]
MNSQRPFLNRIVDALESAAIAYMLSGSMSSSFHGQPRATNDADIVIDPKKEQLLGFINSLGPDYYVSKDAAMQALDNNSMFNVIEIESGSKADLIIRKNRPFSKQEFSRRTTGTVMGIDVHITSPEDSILSKLEWSKDTSSQKQLDDVIGVLTVQWDRLDFDYLKKWAARLNIADQLGVLIAQIQKLKNG